MKHVLTAAAFVLVLAQVACGDAGGAPVGTGDAGSDVVDTLQLDDVTEATSDTNETGEAGEASDTVDVTAPIDPTARLFDPSRVLEVEITMPAADWDALRAETRSLVDVIGPGCLDAPPDNPFDWYHAAVVIDGVRLDDVGIRKKGFLGSLDADRPSLKLRLDRHVSGQAVHGHDRLTLNNGRQDPARFATCMAYTTFEAAGVPAPRCSLAHVRVNGADLGVYINVEDVKRDFLRRYFYAPFGDLYEGTLSDFREGWLATFERKIDEDEPAGTILADITAALDAPDDELLAALSAVIDVDAFVTFWAVEILVNHWDGYAGNTNNFFLYEDRAGGGEAVFMPWGADATFARARAGDPEGIATPIFTAGALANRLHALPAGRALLASRLGDLLDTVWDEGALVARVSAFEALAAPLHAPAARAEAISAAAEMRLFIGERRERLEAALAVAPGEPEPMRQVPCLKDFGTIEGAFTTSWGTIGDDDLFATGTSTLTLDTPVYSGTLADGGARAGFDPEVPGGARFQLLAPAGVDTFLVVDLRTTPDRVAPGSIIPLDHKGAEAYLFRLTIGGEGQLLGLITDGLLSFEAGGTSDGDPIDATFDGTLLSF